MSAESSAKVSPVAAGPARRFGVIGSTLWAIVAYIVPQFAILGAGPYVSAFAIGANARLFIMQALMACLTMGILVWAVKTHYKQSLAVIGIVRARWSDIARAVLCYPLYIGLLLVVTYIVGIVVPQINFDQPQVLSFAEPKGLELALTFVALVIIPPIVEECIFRGFLLSAYRRRVGYALATVLVSSLFALAHGQVNVGIDVFCLSLFLCYLREKTGSLLPCIVLHALKNLIAFVYVFIM